MVRRPLRAARPLPGVNGVWWPSQSSKLSASLKQAWVGSIPTRSRQFGPDGTTPAGPLYLSGLVVAGSYSPVDVRRACSTGTGSGFSVAGAGALWEVRSRLRHICLQASYSRFVGAVIRVLSSGAMGYSSISRVKQYSTERIDSATGGKFNCPDIGKMCQCAIRGSSLRTAYAYTGRTEAGHEWLHNVHEYFL